MMRSPRWRAALVLAFAALAGCAAPGAALHASPVAGAPTAAPSLTAPPATVVQAQTLATKLPVPDVPEPQSNPPPSPVPETITPVPTLKPLMTSTPSPAPTSTPTPAPTPPSETGARVTQLRLPLKDDVTITAVAISPTFADDRLILVTTSDGALYRSTDGGAHWKRQTKPQLGVLAFSSDYAHDHKIFANYNQRGEEYGSPGTLFTYRSTDGGKSWQLQGTQTIKPTSGVPLFISPTYARDHTLFIRIYTPPLWSDDVESGSISRSTDDGATWAPLHVPGPANWLGISPSYAEDQTLYVGCYAYSKFQPWGYVGLYRSTDGGAAWTHLAQFNIVKMLLFPKQPEPPIIAYSGGTVRSADGGQTWDSMRQDLGSVGEMALSPRYDQDRTVLALSWFLSADRQNSVARLLRSTDRGETWRVNADFGQHKFNNYSWDDPSDLAVTLDRQGRLVALVGVERQLSLVQFAP